MLHHLACLARRYLVLGDALEQLAPFAQLHDEHVVVLVVVHLVQLGDVGVVQGLKDAHLVEEALDAASDRGDMQPFEALLEALSKPCEERAAYARFAEPAPGQFTQAFQTFCGT